MAALLAIIFLTPLSIAETDWARVGSISESDEVRDAKLVQIDDDIIAVWKDGQQQRDHRLESSVLQNGKWSAPQRIDGGDPGIIFDTFQAYDLESELLVLWSKGREPTELWSNSFRQGSWGIPERIAYQVESETRLADSVIAGESIVITWTSSGYAGGLWAQEYVSGSWQEPHQLVEPVDEGDDADVLVHSRGLEDTPYGLVSVWTQTKWTAKGYESEETLWSSTLSGGSWSEPERLASNGGLSGLWNVQSQVIAVWPEPVPDPNRDYPEFITLNAAIHGATGWSDPVQVSAEEPALRGWDEITILGTDAPNPPILIWKAETQDFSESVWANVFEGGSWLGPQKITDGIDAHYQFSVNSLQGSYLDGGAIIVWDQKSGDFNSLWMSKFTDNEWTSPHQISNATIGNTKQFILAPMTSSALAVWEQDDAGVKITEYAANDIWASRWDGQSWSEPERLDSSVEDSYRLQLTSLSHGIMATWTTKYRYDDDRIYASEYVGGQWTEAMHVSSAYSGQPSVLEVVSLGDNALLMWSQRASFPFQDEWHAISRMYDPDGWGCAMYVGPGIWETTLQTTEGALEGLYAVTDNSGFESYKFREGPHPLTLNLTTPQNGHTNQTSISVSGFTDASIVEIDETQVNVRPGHWSTTLDLQGEGKFEIPVTAKRCEESSEYDSFILRITVDQTAPNLTITQHPDSVWWPVIEIQGTAEEGSVIQIGDQSTTTGNDGQWSIEYRLEPGPNELLVTASDLAGNSASELIQVHRTSKENFIIKTIPNVGLLPIAGTLFIALTLRRFSTSR